MEDKRWVGGVSYIHYILQHIAPHVVTFVFRSHFVIKMQLISIHFNVAEQEGV